MKQPEMDPDFEAFCRARKLSRRRSSAPGNEGHGAVWSAIEASEALDLQDRMLNAEVDDFFADATRMAATIVKRVAQGREQELTEQLRHDMEDFLADSIRRATNLMESLPSEAEGIGEAEVGTNLKNLGGRELDGFRAEGTAQLEDKHLGQSLTQGARPLDPASAARGPEVDASVGEELETPGGVGDVPALEEGVSRRRLQIGEGELSLNFDAEQMAFEAGPFVDQISGLGAIQPETHPTLAGEQRAAKAGRESVPEDDLPLAALFEKDGSALPVPPQIEELEDSGAVDASAKRRLIRQTLLDLVRGGVLTEEQARRVYQAQSELL